MPGAPLAMADFERPSYDGGAERQGLPDGAEELRRRLNRGLWALRQPLEHLGAHLYPDMFSLAQVHEASDESGHSADPKLGRWFADEATEPVEA